MPERGLLERQRTPVLCEFTAKSGRNPHKA
nr:MAG TPA: hypothetical protein [Caudoviricetes sp.]